MVVLRTALSKNPSQRHAFQRLVSPGLSTSLCSTPRCGSLGWHTDCTYERGDVLLFGCETKGLPRALVDARGAYSIPMRTEGPIRSLNLGNAVSVCAYEAVRQLGPEWA